LRDAELLQRIGLAARVPLTSSAKSSTGKLQLCASTQFSVREAQGRSPGFIQQMWDSNMHLTVPSKALKAGQTYAYAASGPVHHPAHHADPLNEAERLTTLPALKVAMPAGSL
jgi:hypothetical protein